MRRSSRTLLAGFLTILGAGVACLAHAEGGQEPVLLLHGLWGSADSWKAYAQHLVQNGWEESCIIEFAPGATQPKLVSAHTATTGGNLIGSAALSLACDPGAWRTDSVVRVVYRDADGQSFETQGRQVAAAIDVVRRKTGAAKVRLIGHSMGGLAARAYLQSPAYRSDVSAVATVATPHLGSLIPYLARERGARLCNALAGFAGRDLAAPAVKLLAPDAAELVALASGRAPYSGLPDSIHWMELLAHYSDSEGISCLTDVQGWLTEWNQDLARHFDPQAVQSLASGAVLANWTDGVVPVVSQMLTALPVARDLRASRVLVEAFHSDVTEDPEAWRALDDFLAHPAPAPSPEGLTVVLLMDSSGSMADNDPQNLRRRAAEFLLVRLGLTTGFAVIDFDSTARTLVPVTRDRVRVQEGLRRIDSTGGTAICEALNEGLAVLEGAPPGRKVAVLLTDGQSQDQCSGSDFASRGWRLDAVGLSPAADGQRLSRLAREGGGRYLHALDAAELTAFFDVVAADLLNEATLRDYEGVALANGVERIPVELDSSIEALTLSLSWPGSDLDLTLIDPSGRRHDAATHGHVGSTFELIAAPAGNPGLWMAEVTSVDVPPAGEPFRVRAVGRSKVRVEARSRAQGELGGLPLSSVQTIGFGSAPISAEAEVIDPIGERRALIAQPIPGGFEAILVDATRTGPHLVRWSLRQGAIVRQLVDSVFVGALFDPQRASLVRVEGAYAVWERGAAHGIRPGMELRFLRSELEVGRGQVLSVRARDCDVEVFSTIGIDGLRGGDLGVVDTSVWVGTSR